MDYPYWRNACQVEPSELDYTGETIGGRPIKQDIPHMGFANFYMLISTKQTVYPVGYSFLIRKQASVPELYTWITRLYRYWGALTFTSCSKLLSPYSPIPRVPWKHLVHTARGAFSWGGIPTNDSSLIWGRTIAGVKIRRGPKGESDTDTFWDGTRFGSHWYNCLSNRQPRNHGGCGASASMILDGVTVKKRVLLVPQTILSYSCSKSVSDSCIDLRYAARAF